MQQTPWIAPSILSADFARLGEEVRNVLAAGADIVHFDVMDNHYVPNLTIGPLVCEALRKHGITAPIDVHLMVKPVDRIVPDFAKAGATYITFHPEASEHVDRTHRADPRVGLPAWPGVQSGDAAAWLDHVLDKVDMVLLMSVNPGFGGQTFIPSTLPKIAKVRAHDRPQRPRHPSRGRRRHQGRQHRRGRRGGRGYVRRGLGDFRREGLSRDDRRDAGAHCGEEEGEGEEGRTGEGVRRMGSALPRWTERRRSS